MFAAVIWVDATPQRTGPPTASSAIPLNLNLAGALAWQHEERHLHLGLIGLQWEVSLGEQLGDGPNTLLLQVFLEVLRNLKGSDCRQRHRQGGRGSGQGPIRPKTKSKVAGVHAWGQGSSELAYGWQW